MVMLVCRCVVVIVLHRVKGARTLRVSQILSLIALATHCNRLGSFGRVGRISMLNCRQAAHALGGGLWASHHTIVSSGSRPGSLISWVHHELLAGDPG